MRSQRSDADRTTAIGDYKMNSSQAKHLAAQAARLERKTGLRILDTFEIAVQLADQPSDELESRQKFLEHSRNIIKTPGAALAMILKR